MELKNPLFKEYMNDRCKDILEESLKKMVSELMVNAIFVMNAELEAGLAARTIETVVYILKNNKYNSMPIYLVMEGFSKGSMGELGGTTKFTVRNVCVWLNAMYERMAQINAERKTKEDAERRALEAKSYKQYQKISCLFGAAMFRKIEWCKDGVLSSAEYDRLTLDKIVAAVQKGYTLKELYPSMIL